MRLAALQVVDLTDQTRRLASGLSEAYLHCDERQRDEFLYYLLVRSTQSSARFAALTLIGTTEGALDHGPGMSSKAVLQYVAITCLGTVNSTLLRLVMQPQHKQGGMR